MVGCVYVFLNEIVLYLLVGLVFNSLYVKIANYSKLLSPSNCCPPVHQEPLPKVHFRRYLARVKNTHDKIITELAVKEGVKAHLLPSTDKTMITHVGHCSAGLSTHWCTHRCMCGLETGRCRRFHKPLLRNGPPL